MRSDRLRMSISSMVELGATSAGQAPLRPPNVYTCARVQERCIGCDVAGGVAHFYVVMNVVGWLGGRHPLRRSNGAPACFAFPYSGASWSSLLPLLLPRLLPQLLPPAPPPSR